MNDTLVSFVLYEPNLFDIVVNEIMAKPSPSVQLPEAEYIELYNRTAFSVNLNGWRLHIGNNVRTFGDVAIAPHSYLLVTGNSNQGLFEDCAVAYLSSLQITDAGQTFRLTDNSGYLIHSVAFTTEWYGDKTKSGGGWSLEMIDFLNPCGDMENWTASIDKKGGTPGAENSVARRNLDEQLPQLAYVSSDDADKITVFFSEKMLPKRLYNKSAYSIVPNLLIDSILFIDTDLQAVSLLLSASLAKNTIYTLYIRDSLTDCVGNLVPLNASLSFGLGEEPEYNDVIINEILFHPFDDGVNFVEIYNRSNKLIDMRNMRLSTYKKDGSLDTGKLIFGTGFQLFPQSYLVLTTQPRIVQAHYFCPDEQCFAKMNSFPTYNHGSGSVALIDKTNTIDSFYYTENMHYPLLKSVKGVSLERINPHRKTQDNFNWHSAATSVGYATPGYKNSAYSDNQTPESEFELYPEIFSPDNDGYNDVLTISYAFPQPGYRANIHIYNANGKKLRTLVNNELLDTDGYFTWDGSVDGTIKAPVGTYIFLIEYWNTKGEVKRVKKTCTLAIKYR
jgi:gliding motility-associated-like protein